MSNTKIKQLLDQKAKLEQQLKAETEKRLMQIGRLAKKAQMLDWPNEAFTKIFEMAKEKGQAFFDSKEQDNASTKSKSSS